MNINLDLKGVNFSYSYSSPPITHISKKDAAINLSTTAWNRGLHRRTFTMVNSAFDPCEQMSISHTVAANGARRGKQCAKLPIRGVQFGIIFSQVAMTVL